MKLRLTTTVKKAPRTTAPQGVEASRSAITTTGDPDKYYRKKDDGAKSELRAHGRRGSYQDVDSDDHAWDPPEADDDA